MTRAERQAIKERIRASMSPRAREAVAKLVDKGSPLDVALRELEEVQQRRDRRDER